MTFNQSLIEKARKGEIAILNDGSVEELKIVLTAVWPDDTATSCLKSLSDKFFTPNYYDRKCWIGHSDTRLPAHSVKDFFMNTKDPETLDNTVQPRTYHVTRQQMGEIYSASRNGWQVVNKIMNEKFGLFLVEVELTDVDVSMLNSIVPDVEILKNYFPEYFFIPEGEPVLVRDSDSYNWAAAISDGRGKAFQIIGTMSKDWKQIIPFTKNPPR